MCVRARDVRVYAKKCGHSHTCLHRHCLRNAQISSSFSSKLNCFNFDSSPAILVADQQRPNSLIKFFTFKLLLDCVQRMPTIFRPSDSCFWVAFLFYRWKEWNVFFARGMFWMEDIEKHSAMCKIWRNSLLGLSVLWQRQKPLWLCWPKMKEKLHANTRIDGRAGRRHNAIFISQLAPKSATQFTFFDLISKWNGFRCVWYFDEVIDFSIQMETIIRTAFRNDLEFMIII